MIFKQVIDESEVIICCGSGGVGKTTAAAAIGIAAARTGRKVIVVTIDPAKRLADALGLNVVLGNEPHRIDSAHADPGELWAMMLDTQATFNQVVRTHSANSAQLDRIMANRFFHNISKNLSGTQDYMAAEKLFQLHGDTRFNLVVIDTPPTRDALNFLDAPGRLIRFLDHRLYRFLLTPARGGLKVVVAAMQPIVRAIARIVGAQALDDALAFFRAFEGMDEGFRQRASEVVTLLRSPTTSYVVVTSPNLETVTEANYFVSKLREEGLSTAALIVNRIQPSFDTAIVDQTPGPSSDLDLLALQRNLQQLNERARKQKTCVEKLISHVSPAPVRFVPLLAHDVASTDSLGIVALHLMSDAANSEG
ncbi:MAG: ArsA-related P-loop ATPase [Ilumatobacteraceae bacterium]